MIAVLIGFTACILSAHAKFEEQNPDTTASTVTLVCETGGNSSIDPTPNYTPETWDTGSSIDPTFTQTADPHLNQSQTAADSTF